MEWNGMECRVSLRPIRRDDKTILYRWITDRELLILNAPYFPVGEGAHEEWFESMLRGRNDTVFFVIEDIETSQAIGTCQLLNINWVHRNAELQIRIGEPAFHGKGYGSEAIQQLVDFGFRDLHLHRIFLHVFVSNTRAIKAYEKCGFAHEGVLREAAYIDGKYLDVQIMSILRGMNE